MFLLGGPAVCHANVFRSVCTSSHAHRVTSCWLGLHYWENRVKPVCLCISKLSIGQRIDLSATLHLLCCHLFLLCWANLLEYSFYYFWITKWKKYLNLFAVRKTLKVKVNRFLSVCFFLNPFKNERGAVYLYINSGVNYESFFAYRDILYLFY